MRPRIGITTSTLERAPEGPIQITAATHLTYARCVYNAGGLPLLLPCLPEEDDAEEVLSHLDGLLLSGGGDIDSKYWGEALHPAVGLVDPIRDNFEIELVRAAFRRDVPMLGICRGLQVMAVATGGDLWQDIPSQVPDHLNHRQSAPRPEPTHTVTVRPDSLLGRILWDAPTSLDGEQTVCVNSFHHQAPRMCDTIFVPEAISPDGLIEALAAPEAFFALGVQWHPEEMAESDPLQARLFPALVDAAARRMTARPR